MEREADRRETYGLPLKHEMAHYLIYQGTDDEFDLYRCSMGKY